MKSSRATAGSFICTMWYRYCFGDDILNPRIMQLHYHWINLLILFGALQGLLFCMVLLFNKKHPGAKFLSIFMLTFAYNGFETFNWSAGLDHYILLFDFFPYVLIYAVGPSLYLYVTTLLHPDKPLSKYKILLHYIPVLFQFLFRTSTIVYIILWQKHLYQGPVSPAAIENFYWLYSEPLSAVAFIVYLIATIYAFRKEQPTDTIRLISKEGQQSIRGWIKALLTCMVALGIFWPLTLLAPYIFRFDYNEYYYPVEIAIVLFIYWIALAGYHRTRLIYLQIPRTNTNPEAIAQADQKISQLRQIMETDMLYLDPELNLSKMARHTGFPAKTISAILNQHAQKSFNDFVNEYRVRLVQEKLTTHGTSHLTIYGMALEAGFNSQATFQRAFKNITGMSPREYLNQRLQKTA